MSVRNRRRDNKIFCLSHPSNPSTTRSIPLHTRRVTRRKDGRDGGPHSWSVTDRGTVHTEGME